MKKILFYFLLILLLASCGDINNVNNPEFCQTINVNFDVDPINFSDIFSDYELIKIENKIIGKIKKMYALDDKVVFLTTSGDYRVHVYDLKNHSLKSFVEKGKGPFQVSSIRDLIIYDNLIYILDFYKKEVNKYSFTGEFLGKFILPEYCDNIYPISDNIIVLFKKVPYGDKKEYKINVYRLDNGSFKKIYHALPIHDIETERDFAQLVTLFDSEGDVCLTQAFSNIIYKIDSNMIENKYQINFSNKTIPDELFFDKNLDLIDFGMKCKNSNYVWNINCVLESYTKMSFVFRYKNEIYMNLYDKSSKNSITFNTFQDDLFTSFSNLKLSEDFKPMFITNNSIFFLVEPYFIIDWVDNLRKKNNDAWKKILKNEKIYQLLSSLKVDDNTLILKYNFKNEV